MSVQEIEDKHIVQKKSTDRQGERNQIIVYQQEEQTNEQASKQAANKLIDDPNRKTQKSIYISWQVCFCPQDKKKYQTNTHRKRSQMQTASSPDWVEHGNITIKWFLNHNYNRNQNEEAK